MCSTSFLLNQLDLAGRTKRGGLLLFFLFLISRLSVAWQNQSTRGLYLCSFSQLNHRSATAFHFD